MSDEGYSEVYFTEQSDVLNRYASQIHPINREKGFWDNGYNDDVFGTKIALIHSEVSEWLEAIRKEKGEDAEAEEIADVLIRLLDLYEARKISGHLNRSLDDALRQKIGKNRDRPHKHGRRF